MTVTLLIVMLCLVLSLVSFSYSLWCSNDHYYCDSVTDLHIVRNCSTGRVKITLQFLAFVSCPCMPLFLTVLATKFKPTSISASKVTRQVTEWFRCQPG